jgi:hypothetical protein
MLILVLRESGEMNCYAVNLKTNDGQAQNPLGCTGLKFGILKAKGGNTTGRIQLRSASVYLPIYYPNLTKLSQHFLALFMILICPHL